MEKTEDQQLNLANAAKLAGLKSPAFCYHMRGKNPPPFVMIAGRKVFSRLAILEWKKSLPIRRGK